MGMKRKTHLGTYCQMVREVIEFEIIENKELNLNFSEVLKTSSPCNKVVWTRCRVFSSSRESINRAEMILDALLLS